MGPPMIKDVMGNQRTDSTQGTSGAPVPDANDIPVEQRRLAFARETLFDDPSLAGLFALLREVLDKNTRIELSRFARERLRSAFPAGSGNTGDVKLANGLRVAVDLGDSFGAEFLIGHLNESDLLDAVTANIPDGAKIVDVGANFGLYALHAAWAAGPGAQAVAFEPLPSAADLLQRNVETNG
ncbi:MAG: FkbM family methyltransferase, partial [Gammaproteobacteria bacterium]|nr:FkbM family methyltransferase [Gammaproteobacteria bacterium]